MRVGVVVALLCAFVSSAVAESALDKKAFTATPSELLAVAKTKPAGTTDAFILREESEITFVDAARSTNRWRQVYVVTSQAGANEWNALGIAWSPDHQDKPTIRIRVIDPAGTAHDVDVSRANESPVPNSTRHQLEVRLPTLAVGSIVEEEILSTNHEPLPGGGDIETFTLSADVPVVSMRITIAAPAKRKLHVVAWGIPAKPKRETRNGQQRVIYTAANVTPPKVVEAHLAPDTWKYPFVSASVGESWAATARAYRAALDKRLAEVPFPAAIAKSPNADTAAALLGWLQRSIRRDAADVRDASLLPLPPPDVIKRGIADDVSRAALLVQLMRQAGMTADLVAIAQSGMDVTPELVSLDAFDHLIVRAKLDGKDVWIDPSDVGARVGQLPPFVQSRQALVIADSTTGLIRTPASAAKDNVARETRTFEIAEWGAAKVTEVSTTSGIFEPFERKWIRDMTPDVLRKDLERYVSERYVEAKLVEYKTTPVDDFSKPFEVTLVAASSKRGLTTRERADVFLFPADVLDRLPRELGKPDEHAPIRKHDLYLRVPYTDEIVNRLVAPTGFDVPQPIADKTRMLGVLKLIEQQRRDGQALVVTWRLEVTKQRLSPAEVAATQAAVRALRSEQAELFVFEQTAYALVAQGKYREALGEIQRVIKLHPKEALHQSQLAMLLLKMGAGEPARRAAKIATELEPKNAEAFLMYGWVLSHDTFGHWRGFDHDYVGARAAYEQVRKLDGKHVGAAIELAKLLERGAKGRLYNSLDETKAAITAWRVAFDGDPTDVETGHALVRALLYVGNATDAETVARKLPESDVRNHLLVAALAMNKGGAQTAIATATSLASGDARTRVLQGAAAQLMMSRRYDEMRALYAVAPIPNPQFKAIVQTMKRQDAPKLGREPEDLVRASLIDLAHDNYASPVYADKTVADEMRIANANILTRITGFDAVPPTVLKDMLLSAMTLTAERAEGVARVEMEQLGTKSSLYVALGTTPKIIGATITPKSVGRYLLTRLAAGDEKSAAAVLDWMGADLPRAALSVSKPFALVWEKNLPRTKQAMELAAALLASETDKRTHPIFKRCGATTSGGQLVCDVMLSEAYASQKQWAELEDHAEAFWARSKIPMATILRARALAHLGRVDDAEQVVAEYLKANPDDHVLMNVQIELAWAKAKPQQAVQRGDALAARQDATAQDLNNAAWMKLSAGGDLANAHAIIQRGLQLEPNAESLLNTAAAIEAEQHDLSSARTHLEASRVPSEQPDSADWYVHGRILEQLGASDDAVRAYRRVKSGASLLPDSHGLAAKRLKALGVTKN